MKMGSQSARSSRIASLRRLDLRDRFALRKLRRRSFFEDRFESLRRRSRCPRRARRAGARAGCAGARAPLRGSRARRSAAPGPGGCAPRRSSRIASRRSSPGQVAKRGGGLEDVVVVGDDRVGALGELELHLERADLLAAGLFEDGVGVEVRIGRRGAARAGWTAPSCPGIRWRNGRSPRGRGSGHWRTSGPWRGPGACGTPARSWPRARRPPSSAGGSWTSGKRPAGRTGGPRPEPGAGPRPSCRSPVGRLGEQVLAVVDRRSDGLDDLLLDRPGGRVGEGQPFGRFRLAGPRGLLGAPDAPGRGRGGARSRAPCPRRKATWSEISSPVSMST